MESLGPIITQLIAGAIGGNATSAVLKQDGINLVARTIAGAIGGLGGGLIVNMIGTEALTGLVKRGDTRVLRPLMAALQGEAVGSQDVQSAKDLGSPELLPALEALRSWWDVDAELLEGAIVSCNQGERL